MKRTGIFQIDNTEALYADLLRANTESAKKERFLQYLTVEFAGDQGAQKLISAMALGAEQFIANITREGRLGKGKADSQTDTIIIEWEKDLSKTGEHAKHQLEEYLEGNWRSGRAYRFVLLTTDGIRWRRYAPDWSEVAFGEFTLGRNFKLRETRSFNLTPDSFADFPFFLDEILFGTQPRLATLDNIQTDFGDTSSVFINSLACLMEAAKDIKQHSVLKVAYEQWRRFLSIAYGKFDDSPSMFLVHTYLSVFAKFIAYVVVTKKSIDDDDTIKGILNGAVFENLNIERFVEDDFFHWVFADPYFKQLRPVFREIHFALSSYDFAEVQEDILKGLYQELIDLETRHALGEYYTPDWLCERIVAELKITSSSSFLDPACGSGSFLRAIIARMRHDFPGLGASSLAEQIVGIDIHPLSVLIARTTVLLSLGTAITLAKRPVTLQIYLANSLLVPRGAADLFRDSFKISVDNKEYAIELRGLHGSEDFDKLISFCDNIVRRYEKDAPIERDLFDRMLMAVMPREHAEELPRQLYEIYKGMKSAHVLGRDSIWRFILQNSYKPVFLMNRFDYVVGNPPWLTYSSVTNSEYQGLLRNLSDGYHVTPLARANIPHLEIAAIFLAHSVNYFLKQNGKLVFVLPRSFLSADHHENTRAGLTEGVRLTSVWDLGEVSVLFRVPCCVLFAIRTPDEPQKRVIPQKGIPGLFFSGRLPKAQIHWTDAKTKLLIEPKHWFYSSLQKTRGVSRSALTVERIDTQFGTNAYAAKFSQGATIVPRNFFFVEIDQQIPKDADLRERVIALRTSSASDREAKAPWKGNILTGRVEGTLLYRTAISKNLIPFSMVCPPLVVLPVVGGVDDKPYAVLSAEALLERGFTYGSDWFFAAEACWEKHKTENNRKMATTLAQYLNWQNKLTDQNPKARYLVLYTSSATDASAAVIDRRQYDFPFIVDHKTYWCECTSLAEAHYISAYLNSDYANGIIKDFQSRGLFGPRDIHKLILKIPFPKFQKESEDHKQLSALAVRCTELTEGYVKSNDLKDLKPGALGGIRSNFRDQLSPQLGMIDELVAKLSTGKMDAQKTTLLKRKTRFNKSERLFD